MHIHLCVVSDQMLPNLIPILQEHPDLAVLLSSNRMQGRTEHLARQIRRQGIGVEIRPAMPDHGLDNIYHFALELQEYLDQQYPGAQITLNATGGNKLMALGLVNFCREYRMIYTDTAYRRIEVLPSDTQGPAEIPMVNVLTVQDYLNAQGFQCQKIRSRQAEWQEAARYRKQFCKRFAKNVPNLGNLIGMLNGCAGQSLSKDGNSLLAPKQKLPMVPREEFAEILEDLNQRDLLAWRVGTAEITFVDAESARFLSGGWLEEYVYHVLKDNDAFDVLLGVEGRWGNGQGNKNEFDVLATQNNALLFVECKTLTYRVGQESEIAYKLEALGQDARGLFGKSWLVTARQPTANLLDHASRARFEVIGPEELPRLRDRVQAWLKGSG